jgi:parallel beta-helix repeat protein
MDKDTATSRLILALLILSMVMLVFVVSASNSVIAGISDPETVRLETTYKSDVLGLKTTENLLHAEESAREGDTEHYSNITAGSSVTCNSCEDCTRKLNNGYYDTVILSQNILNHTGNCITLSADNVVFDCSGHFISGDLPAAPFNVDYGIKVTGDNNVITNCNVALFWYGLWLDSANYNTITGNNLALNAYSGLTLANSNNNILTANTMNFNSYGLAILNSDNTEINSNAACGNLIADIWQENSSGNAGSNNTCYNTHNWNDTGTVDCTHLCCLVPSNDMRIEKDAKFCPGWYNITDAGAQGVVIINASNIVLDGNGAVINGSGSGYGIYNPGFDNVTITNVTIRNYGTGMQLVESDNSIISQNNVSYSAIKGIAIDSSYQCEVSHNRVSYSAERGIAFGGGGDNAAYNNIVFNNSAFGAIEAVFSNNNEIYNNAVSFNQWGIATNHGSSNQIHNNTIYGNELGVHLDWPSENNRVFNNNISSNYAGIWINHNSTNNIISDNLIVANEASGIGVETNSNIITNNTAQNNRVGLYLGADTAGNMVTHNSFCNNTNFDIRDDNSNSGDENTCDTQNGWDDEGTTGCTYPCVSGGESDLIITDIWSEGERIWYQVRNIGNETATGGHWTGLLVDGLYRANAEVAGALAPGERYTGFFDYTWWCAGGEDIIAAVADYNHHVPEANETNNQREEIWKCDTTPPRIISGPIVSEVTQTSALITWETDEASDSAVHYGNTARFYPFGQADATLVQEHELVLTGLEPSTTYQVKVQSADASDNNVESKAITFETPPLIDGEDPTVSIIDPGVCQGIITIFAEVDDNTGVEKVEYFFGETLVSTDFLEEQSYRLPKLSLDTTKYENGQYALKAKAYDLSGRYAIDERIIRIANIIDVTAPVVTITSPSQWATVSDVIIVNASVSDEEGLSHGYFWVGPDPKGHYASFFYGSPYPKNATIKINWNTKGADNGPLRIAWEVYDKKGNVGWGYQDVIVNNPLPPAPPKLIVTNRDIKRNKNYFTITLTVKNVGGQAATSITLWDYLQLFQPIDKSDSVASYKSAFNPQSMSSKVEINSKVDIPKEGEQTYSYDAVPILTPESAGPYASCPYPMIGMYGICGPGWWKPEGDTHLQYKQPGGVGYFHEWVNLGEKIPDSSYFGATQEANYLIVTNPSKLFALNPGKNADVNSLFSDMARLAKLKNGTLGYLSSSDPNVLRNLIKPCSGWSKANWAYRLHPDFSKPLKGYVLIVGETEIIPSWDEPEPVPGYSVNNTDHPYADTTVGGPPALILGRLIGDDAANLTKPIQASIGVFEGSTGYAFDRKKALMVSGPGGGVGSFVKSAEDVAVTLQNQKFSVEKLHMKDYYVVSSFPRDYEQLDGFAVGDVLGGVTDEIVIGDASANKIAIYNATGTLIFEFGRTFDGGDGLAVGDVMGYGKDQIIHADDSHDYIYITEIQETSPGIFSAVVVHSIPASFDKDDRLAVGDVVGDAREEVLISDISLDKIFIRRMDATMWSWFDYYGLEKYDLFAVGDFMGNAKEEIVVADRSANEMFVFNSSGGPALASLKFHEVNVKGQNQKVKWLVAMGEGAALAVGNVHTWGKDEIIIGAPEYSEHIRSYWWNANDKKLLETGGIPFEFDSFDGLAAGGNDEIFIADKDGVIRTFDAVNVCTRVYNVLPGLTQNVDVIYWHGHGNAGSWPGACIYSDTARAMDFGNHNPFIMTASCSTGNYESGAIAESFLASGAAVYIGSTEPTYWTSRETAEYFFENWTADESIGEVFTDMEKSVWGKGDLWNLYVWQHNLYGDPKYGRISSTATGKMSSLVESESPTPPSSLQVEVPDYVVATLDGLDYVEIPGGYRWYEPGQLWVPFYSVSIDYPIGYQVQDVALLEKSGLVTDTNLSIPMTPLNITPSTYAPVPYFGTLEDWFPDKEYSWETLENPDGTTTLVIILYPFYYNPLTTDVKFYKNYSFDINYMASPVAITTLTTDRNEYHQDDTVIVDIGLNNSGEPQDVIFSASVNRYGSGNTVDGLLLRTLKDFAGPASFSPRWDSDGFEPGYYFVEVTLKDTGGNVLDTETELFRLGISSGVVTALTATPEHFELGDEIAINMTFANTGTVNLTGTAIVRVINGTGGTVEEYRHNVTDLLPSESVGFRDTWDTSGAEEGSYTIVGYVLYDGKATDPVSVMVGTETGGFDTGPGGYPSIAGTHNGTIRPNQTMLIHGLYTYPNSGTGGHAEYVKIWQGTGTLVEAEWTGYGGDWQNITFDAPIVLDAEETYYYTITTGSYPQIIHEPSWNATGGKITCTEFVDVNGKRHEGWIPAIRLQ